MGYWLISYLETGTIPFIMFLKLRATIFESATPFDLSSLMVGKKWKMIGKHPEDIIGAARTMGEGEIRIYHDPIPHWVPAADYLDWARRGLKQDDLNGRDAAVCYAKRAVCRFIDSLMVCNHLGAFLGRGYKEKFDLLSRIDLPIPTIVHELVINQRNDIEHSYQAATAVQASRALELAELLLERRSMIEELPKKALISLGSNVQLRVNDQPPDFSEVQLSMDDPWLLVDTLADDPKVLVIYPKDDEVAYAQLSDFDTHQAISVSRLMRERQQAPLSFMRGMIYEGRNLQGFLYLLGLAPRPSDPNPKG